MPLETASTIAELNENNPVGASDTPASLDNHIRLVKTVLKSDAMGASTVNAATTKATPVDADSVGLVDSAASNVLKKLTWANLKAAVKAYFDTLYLGISATAANATNATNATNIISGDLAFLLDDPNNVFNAWQNTLNASVRMAVHARKADGSYVGGPYLFADPDGRVGLLAQNGSSWLLECSTEAGNLITAYRNWVFGGNISSVGGYPAYQCRAWCLFNGAGTVALSAGGNVSSITDNGTGDYTVNFTYAMPDTNYGVQVTPAYNGSAGQCLMRGIVSKTTSAVRFYTGGTAGQVDFEHISVSIHR